jgi:hypothetical protein
MTSPERKVEEPSVPCSLSPSCNPEFWNLILDRTGRFRNDLFRDF